jgi:hypothetical protein
VTQKPKYIEHELFRLPMGFSVEAFCSALDYPANPEDIFVCSYPKCGTTWLQNVVYLILNDGVPLSSSEFLPRSFPHLEEVGKEICNKLPTPRLIKTHLPFMMTPQHSKARYLYIARNPFDCAVSFFHHTRGFPQHYDFLDGTFEGFFECFINGEVDFGDYFDNLMSWYRRKDEKNIFFITYESMKIDSYGAIIAIGDFLGVDDAKMKGIIDNIMKHSGFKAMQQHQTRWSSFRSSEVAPFIRKGVVGDWKNYFTPKQSDLLLERFFHKIKGTSIDKLWSDIIESADHNS